MSTSIDQQVVQMRFDNRQFEQGVAQSMSTLDKFKAKLSFKGSEKDFEDISRAANNVSLDNLIKQTDKAGQGFDAMAVVAITALTRMTNAAISAGTSMVKSLSVDQITAGWTKYEQKTGSVQTIMNATGKSIDEVNGYLDKLMWFSDETSYGFTDMTAAIGQLTSAGGDIDKLVPMVMGIANATAFAGKGVNEFSRAIYNLNQSYSSGHLQYMDWKSLELAGIASKQLKEVFIDTAVEMGKVQKGAVTIANFGETLKDKWADTEVMERAFGKFGEMTEKAYQMVNSGMVETASEAYELLSQTNTGFAITAARAAQEAKSFGEAVDATKDAVSSGWMKTYEIIFGNYEEAKKLWTDLANTMWDIFASGANDRNEMLQTWKDLGGRAHLIEALSYAFKQLQRVLGAVHDAIVSVFPPQTAKGLLNLTIEFKRFIQSLTITDEALTGVRIAVKILLIPVNVLWQLLKAGGTIITKFITTLVKLADAFLKLPSLIGTVNDPLRKVFGDDRYGRVATALKTIVDKLGSAFSIVSDKVMGLFGGMQKIEGSRLSAVLERVRKALEPIGDWILDRIVDGVEAIAMFDFEALANGVITAIEKLGEGIATIAGVCIIAIDKVREFFASFKDQTPQEFFRNLIGAMIEFKDNVYTFVKGLGVTPIINSLKTEMKTVTDVIGGLAEALANVLAKLTPARILIFSFGVSVVWMFTAISKSVEAFTGISKGISGTLTQVQNTLKAFQSRIKGSQITHIAIAIGVLAASLVALSLVDSDKLVTAAKALGALMVILGVLVASMAAVNKFLVGSEKMAESLQKVGIAMIAMAAAVAALSGALFILSKIDMTGMGERLLYLGIVIAAIAGFSALMGKIAPELSKNSLFLVAFAFALGSVINSLEKLGNANLTGIETNLASLIAIMGILAGLSLASSNMSFGSAAGMTLMILDILLFVKVLQQLSNVDIGGLANGIVAFMGIIGLLSLMFLSTRALGEQSVKVGGSILAMSAAVVILGFAIKQLGEMDLKVVAQGTIVVAALLLLFKQIISASLLVGKESGKMGTSFIAMSVAILILGAAIGYIGNLELKQVIQGGVVVAALLGLFTVLMKAAGTAGKAVGSITAMSFALGLIVAAVALLTLLDFNDVMGAAIALGTVFLGFGAAMKLIQGVKWQDSLVAVMTLMVLLTELETAFRILETISDEGLIEKAASIGIIMASLGACMALIQATSKQTDWNTVGQSIAMMASLVVVASAALWSLSLIGETDGLITKATALSEILLALSGGLAILQLTAAKEFDIAGTIATMLTLMGGATLIVAALTYLPFDENLMSKAASLSVVLLAVSAAMAIVSTMAPMLVIAGSAWQSALAGIAVIGGGLIALAALIIAAGYLFKDMEGLDAALDAAQKTLVKLGAIMGEFLGSIISGFAAGLLSDLPTMGEYLSQFAEKVQGFLDLRIDSDLVASIGRLVEIAALMTGASFLDAIAFWNGDKTSMDVFGQQLEDFGPHLKAFSDSITGISISNVNTASRAMEALSVLVKSMPTDGGIISLFTGEKSLKKFGEGLAEFAPGFVDYSKAISGVSEDVETKTKYVASAMKSLADSIPNSGGIIQGWLGESDIGLFGDRLSAFAIGLQDFFQIVTGQKEGTIAIDTSVVTSVANAGKALADFAQKIPSAGGSLQRFFGEKNVGSFGSDLALFAQGLSDFFAIMKDANIDDAAYKKAITIGTAFKEFGDTLPTDHGMLQLFTGSKNIATFGDDIQRYGESLVGFFVAFKDATITDADIELAKSAGLAFTTILADTPQYDIINKLFGNTDLTYLGNSMNSFAESMLAYSNKVTLIDFDSVDKSFLALRELADIYALISEIDIASSDAFADYLDSLATTNISGFVATFSDAEEQMTRAIVEAVDNAFASASDLIRTDGTDYTIIIDAMVAGIDAHVDTVAERAQSVCAFFVNGIRDEWASIEESGSFIITSMIVGINDSSLLLISTVEEVVAKVIDTTERGFGVYSEQSRVFYEIGVYCIRGYAEGLESGNTSLMDKIAALGRAIVEKFEKSLGVASPSVEFAQTAKWCILGFNKGIEDNTKTATNSMIKMGAKVLQSIKDFFGIHSPSTVTRDEVGRYLVQGIAEGITMDNSAEEAAAKKAQNICNAFQAEIDKFQLDMTTLDLEFELWEKAYWGGDEQEYALKQMEMLEKKLRAQAENVNLANGEYQATLMTLGAGAEETQEAYNKYLREQISFAELASDFVDLRNKNGTNWGQFFLQYDQILKANMDAMLEAGMTMDEIRAWAEQQSGWSLEGSKNDALLGRDTQGVMEEFLRQAESSMDGVAYKVGVVLQEDLAEELGTAAEQAVTAATPQLIGAGTNVAQQVASGISSEESKDAIQNAMNALPFDLNVDTAEMIQNVGSGLENGLDNLHGLIGTAGDKLGNWLKNGFDDSTDSHSPSREFYARGEWVVQGLANGLDATGSLAVSSVTIISDQMMAAVEATLPTWNNIGEQIAAGMARGVSAGASAVVAAATRVASAAIAGTQKALGIQSPSRVFYKIGEFIDQGLANGITDEYIVVEGSLTRVAKKMTNTDFVIQPVMDWDDWDITRQSTFLQWDGAGNIVPYGYGNSANGSRWIKADASIIQAIRRGDEELEKAMYKLSMPGSDRYLDLSGVTEEEYRKAPTYQFNQTINSPEQLNAAELYRKFGNQFAEFVEFASDHSFKYGTKAEQLMR